FFLQAEDGIRDCHVTGVQTCALPILLTLVAMQDCGREIDETMQRALDWCLKNEIRFQGDWSQKVRCDEPSGWAFERANLHYPDLDDTAVALIMLARLPEKLRRQPRIQEAIRRAVNWTLAMQSSRSEERRVGREWREGRGGG